MSLIDRFTGDANRRRLLEELGRQDLVDGDADLAEEIANRAELRSLEPGEVLIDQGADDDDIYLILAGLCDVVVNGRPIAVRGPRKNVGEMAAIQPTQPRAATVVAREQTVVARLSEADFAEIAGRHPQIYRTIAAELARRLFDRNALVGAFHEGIHIFIISSVEGLPVARVIQSAFEHDPFDVEIWTDGCFKASNYTIESLEAKIEQSDFAIAIAHADDVATSRDQTWPVPRDNVIFELGLFMGRLGRKRAILMEPREEKVRLPSDLAGITTIPYRFEAGPKAASLMGPACSKLREHIQELRARND